MTRSQLRDAGGDEASIIEGPMVIGSVDSFERPYVDPIKNVDVRQVLIDALRKKGV